MVSILQKNRVFKRNREEERRRKGAIFEFIRLALHLPKYISVKHDSSGLPYVKDRLLSRAIRNLERITENPLVEESISSNNINPAWDRFPTPLSIIRPVSL